VPSLLAGVPEVYAATIVDPDGAAVSIYRGLRRDAFPIEAGGMVAVDFFSHTLQEACSWGDHTT
jgi:hypothetical protein